MSEDNSKHQKMTDAELKDANQALKELREIIESKDAEEALNKEKVVKLEEALDKYDEKSQEMVASIEQERKEIEEQKSRLDELEAKMSRVQSGDFEAKEKAKAEMKSFEKYMIFGEKKLEADDHKYLRTDVDNEGGFLAPEDYRLEIIKKITEVTPFRSFASVLTTSRGIVELPKRETNVNSAYRGEGENIIESNQTYGIVRIPVQHLDGIVVATTTMLSDSAFDMEAQITADYNEESARVEGAAYITGNGLEQPQGILNADAEIIPSNGGAGVIDADDFYDLQGALKTGYNGVFMLNRRTRAAVRKLKGTDGHYLFAAASESMPATIAGDPFIATAIDMPDIAAAALPVAYGDWARAYQIVDGTALSVLRDPYTLASQGKVRWVFTRRHGGKVKLSEAYKLLQIN